MPKLQGRNIVVGVSGGIAAYKACELVRALKKRGAHVAVVMTASATRLVQPLTFGILSENPVLTDLWETPSLALDFEPRQGLPAGPVGHVDLGAFADVLLVAPATANLLAKAAHGLADDALSTVLVAARNRVIFAPSMNVNMWESAAVRANVATLRSRGALVLEPGVGPLACGWEGRGRMPEPEELAGLVERELAGAAAPAGDPEGLRGRTVLVTAGPTEEPIDQVRYLGNRSSGKMGYAVAESARDMGARVVLVSGPTALPAPAGVERIQVRTASEMHEAVMAQFPAADIVVMAAAVADYRPAEPVNGKIKRAGPRTLSLVPNDDILGSLGRMKGGKFLVGFALEVESCMANAEMKLRAKQADLIVLNNPMEPGSAFGGDTNRVTLLAPGREPEALPLLGKRAAADHILRRVAGALAASPAR